MTNSGLKRALALRDLILLNIVAVYTPGTLGQTLPLGKAGLALWALGLLTFMLPYAAALADLTHQFPREGGVYAWTRMALGDFHGFVCGWCYWVNTFLYVPSVFLGVTAVVALLGGERTAWLNQSPLAVTLVACAALWLAALLHIVGLGQGKWMQNLGAFGRLAIAAGILVAALYKVFAGNANYAPATAALSGWPALALWPFALNALVGLDLGAAMSEEADDARQNIPRSLWTGGLTVAVCYLLTFSALLFLAVDNPDPIYGHVQAINAVLGDGLGAKLVILIELIGLLGIGAAWLAAPARVPFAIGLDHYLPATFARVHPRFGTPYVALLVQASVATLLIVIYNLGATLKDAYLALLGSSIVLVMVTYLYLLVAWLRLSRPRTRRVWLLSTLGLGAVGLALAAAFLPPPAVENLTQFELKLVGSAVGMLAAGLLLYKLRRAA